MSAWLGAYEGVRFQFGAGDPTLRGWGTTLGYVVAAGLCLRAVQAARLRRHALREAVLRADEQAIALFWLALGLVMLVLGANKQLDLQTLFMEVARVLSHQQGWYEQRRFVQAAFIGVLLGGAGALGLGLLYLLRHVLGRIALPLSGLCLLVIFVLVRAITFQRFSALAWAQGAPSYVLELSGIVVVMIAAMRAGARAAR